MINKKEIFEQAQVLVARMKQYRETATLAFKDMNEKKTITPVYSFIYPGVLPNLACDSCVLLYLNQITAWFSREYPLYLKSIEEVKTISAVPEKKLKPVQVTPSVIDLSGKKPEIKEYTVDLPDVSTHFEKNKD